MRNEWPDHIRIGHDCVQRRAYSREDGAPLQDCGILKAGLSDLRGEYDISRSNYLCHVVFFTLDGAGELSTPEGEFPLRKGSLMTVPSGSQARYRIKGDSWRIAWFDIKKSERWRFLEKAEAGVRDAGAELPRLVQAMEELCEEIDSRKPMAASLARLLAEQIAILLVRELKPAWRGGADEAGERLDALFSKIERRLQAPWTVGTIAKEAGLSPSRLHSLCRERLETSPLKLLTELRMRKAQELLAQSFASVSDIANSVGYENPLNFSTAFSRFAKLSPREFRRKALSKEKTVSGNKQQEGRAKPSHSKPSA